VGDPEWERGSWGGDIEPPPHQPGGLRECCKLLQWAWGRAPTANTFWTY